VLCGVMWCGVVVVVVVWCCVVWCDVVVVVVVCGGGGVSVCVCVGGGSWLQALAYTVREGEHHLLRWPRRRNLRFACERTGRPLLRCTCVRACSST
jgi:hypothetical protein